MFLVGSIIRNQYITSIGLFYKNRGFYLEECFTAKNYWGLLTGDDGVGFGEINTAQINVVQLLRIYWK